MNAAMVMYPTTAETAVPTINACFMSAGMPVCRRWMAFSKQAPAIIGLAIRSVIDSHVCAEGGTHNANPHSGEINQHGNQGAGVQSYIKGQARIGPVHEIAHQDQVA